MMRSGIVTLAAVLAVTVAVASTASAQQETYTNTVNTFVPDHRPMILGTVVSTTSHSVTVHTNEGERMTFEIDSRTMMPRGLQSGTPVRIEFHLMDAGTHHAGRITPLQPNSLLGTPEQAMHRVNMPASTAADDYAQNTSSDLQRSGSTSGDASTSSTGDVRHTDANGNVITTADNRLIDDQGRSAVSQDEGAMNASDDQLPQTASPQPWLLTFGIAAITGAVGLVLGRRQRRS